VQNLEGLLVYPNPVSENSVMKFNLNERSDIEMKVYDLTGKIVKQYEMKNLTPDTYEIPLNTAGLTKGTYIVTLKNKSEIDRTKIVKTE
jgi:hypothetical protein